MTTATTNAAHECVCIECNETFPTPAVGICPACSSRQIRRANPLERSADDLAEQIHRAMGTLSMVASYLGGAEVLPHIAQSALDRAKECEETLAGFYRAKNEPIRRRLEG